MKQMIYKPIEFERLRDKNVYKAEILYSGTIDEYKFNVISLCSHPTAYIMLPKDHPDCLDHENRLFLEVNEGRFLTFEEETDYCGLFNYGYWIGWDYASSFDYTENKKDYNNISDLKKWTTKEIFEDVKVVIEKLKQRKNIKNEH